MLTYFLIHESVFFVVLAVPYWFTIDFILLNHPIHILYLTVDLNCRGMHNIPHDELHAIHKVTTSLDHSRNIFPFFVFYRPSPEGEKAVLSKVECSKDSAVRRLKRCRSDS